MEQSTRPTPEQVGEKFVAVLETWLDAETLHEIAKTNAAEDNPSVCATGSFCDSNMAMLEAMETWMPDYSFDINNDELIDLWNKAWDCGKAIIRTKYLRSICRKDSDCVVNGSYECDLCGVSHGGAACECGGIAYHNDGCPGIEDEDRRVNPSDHVCDDECRSNGCTERFA